MSEPIIKAYEELCKKLCRIFSNSELLELALTHKSFSGVRNNERLEFLGDAVLSMATSAYFFEKYPEYCEGDLSKIKSVAVSRKSLHQWALNLGIGNFIKISPAEEAMGGRNKESILANTMEAIIGAIYIDSGYESAARFVWDYYDGKKFELVNFKSRLQEFTQLKYKILPLYVVAEESGPEHEKCFKISVNIGLKELGTGYGRSKKEAEQSAARSALEKLEALSPLDQ